MKDIMGMMKKAQELQGKMQQMQADLAAMEVTGQAGGGLVKATLSGKGDVKGMKIDPSLLKPDDADMLEDLIIAACADAKGKAEVLMQAKVQEATAGLPIPPGMKLF
jgi:nucleoid-associated protein EbfC